MSLLRRSRLIILAAAILALVAVATASAVSPALQISSSGVGGVKVGKTYKKLRAQHLIGKIAKGCELAPGTRSAPLRSPLKGKIDFTLSSPRKAAQITIRGGATARGVGIDATIAEIKAVYPKAVVDHSTDKTFLITLVKIPKRDGGKFQFAVDTKTGKTTLIGIPRIPFCE